MIEIKETLVIKSDSPKVAEWVKRMKAYKAAQLQDMAKRGCEVCEIAMYWMHLNIGLQAKRVIYISCEF